MTQRRPRVAVVVQGVLVGGMERCALQTARAAQSANYDARLILYDTPYGASEAEFTVDDLPLAFVPRRDGIDFGFPIRLRQLFAEWRIELVHARNHSAGIYCAAALAMSTFSKLPLIITFDTYPGKGSARAKLASRWSTRRAQFVTAVSENLCVRLKGGRWAAKCITVPNGVDPDEFTPQGPTGNWRKSLGIAENEILIAHVARVDANKRQTDLLEALGMLRTRHPNTSVIFAGDGPKRAELERECAGVPGVYLVRRVVDVPAFLREVDIVVLCSDDEGTPRTVLEAMSCERVVVASAVGGIPDLVGTAGILVRPRCPDELAAGLIRACDCRAFRSKIGREARERVSRDFNLDREWSAYQALYERVLRGVFV